MVNKPAKKKKREPNIIVVKKIKSYSNDPFFVEKKQRAIEFLKEHPIPEEILNHMKKKS
jgi:hypothetical protein